MVQIIEENRKRTSGENVIEALKGAIESYSQFQEGKRQKQSQQLQGEQLSKLTGQDLSGLDPETQKMAAQLFLQGRNQQALELLKQSKYEKPLTPLQEAQKKLAEAKISDIEATEDFFNQVMGGRQQQPYTQDENQILNQQMMESPEQESLTPQEQQKTVFDFKDLDENKLRQLSAWAGYPGKKGAIGNGAKNEMDRRKEEKKTTRQTFESERQYHSGYTKELEKNANLMRDMIPKKEMSLDFARNAIETGDVSFFSPDKLADALGPKGDVFRTAKGAQLITAGKENLLTNISRVSAKAQNQWLEQRMNSMFPKIGQSKEANLTVQEMLEGELALDKAYVNEFDRLSSEDEEKYGFVKKDISKRIHDNIRPLEKEVVKRTTFRMKEIEENEKGLSSLKNQVGKNVVKGTPLTLANARLYKSKYGKEALNVAEKNGYYIPTLEEFKIFQQRPQEFREGPEE